MASYLSTPDSPQEYQSPINLNLLNQALSVNQGKYDNGLQKYQNNLQQLKIQENLLIRDEDKIRFSQNVQGLIDEVNKNGKINWAKSGLTNKINTYTNLALDDYTLDQIGISQNIRNFSAEIDAKKKKNDGTYTDTNYAYAQAQAGLQDYLNGVDSQGNKVDKIGKLQYSNYVDVTKSALEKAKSFKELRGDEVVEIPITGSDGVRRMQKTSIKGLTESEIVAYMPQILSPEENQQLQINGWAKYQGIEGLKVAQNTFKLYSENLNKNLDENIKLYDTRWKNALLSPEEREKAFRNKTSEEDRKEQYNASFSSIDPNNVASIGGFLETNSWKANFAKMAGAKTSITYDTDSAFYQAANLELAQAEEQRRLEKHPFEVEKLRLDVQKTTNELAPTTTAGVSLTTIPTENVQETNPYTSLVKDFNSESANIVQLVGATINGGGIDKQTKDAYNTAFQESKRKGYADATSAKIAFSRSGLSELFPAQYADILEASTRRNDMASVIKEAQKESIRVFNQSPDKYITSLKRGIDSAMMAGQSSLYADVANVGEDALASAQSAQDFVNKNGGWENLKQKLQQNPNLISQFENHLEVLKNKKESVSNAFLNPTLRYQPVESLSQDASKRRNEAVVEKGKGVITTADIATFTNEKLKEQVIRSIPQKEGEVSFSTKEGLTVRRTPDGNFELIQSASNVNSKGVVIPDIRKHIVKKGDDIYNLIESQVSNEAQKRGVSAKSYDTTINNDNIKYISAGQETLAEKAATYITGKLGNQFTMSYNVNPTYYLTKETTALAYKQQLRGIVPEEKIELLTNLMSTDMNNKFQVTATPVQGQWNTRVSIKKGTTPLLLPDANTGKENMDKDLLIFIKQYPQISIGASILSYIKKDPKRIDEIIQRLQ